MDKKIELLVEREDGHNIIEIGCIEVRHFDDFKRFDFSNVKAIIYSKDVISVYFDMEKIKEDLGE